MKKTAFVISLLAFSLVVVNFVSAENRPLGPGATGCGQGTTWDENQGKCVACAQGTASTLINSMWQCLRSTTQTQTQQTQVQTQSRTTNSSSGAVSSGVSVGQTSSGMTSIKQGNMEVTATKKLDVVDHKIYMETSSGTKEVKVFPKEASLKATGSTSTPNKIELQEQSQMPVYNVTGEKTARLFFLIPVNLITETKISAETGNIVSVSKPWWSFLAW